MFPAELIAEIGVHLNQLTWINLICTCKNYYNNQKIKTYRDTTRVRVYASKKLLFELIKYKNIQLIKEISQILAPVNPLVIFDKQLHRLSAWTNSPNIIQILLENFQPKNVEKIMIKIYIYACSQNKRNIVYMYLADKTVHPDPFSPHKSTFGAACKNKNMEIAQLILQHPRVEPSADNNYYFIKACKHGLTDIVKILLQNETVDPTCCSNLALIVATENSHVEVVDLLLQNARVKPDKHFKKGLKCAITTKNLPLIKLYLSHHTIIKSVSHYSDFKDMAACAKNI
jgi:hypothetical protein